MQKILSIFDKMHFLLISQNEFFFHEIKRDGITSLHGIHENLYVHIRHQCINARQNLMIFIRQMSTLKIYT